MAAKIPSTIAQTSENDIRLFTGKNWKDYEIAWNDLRANTRTGKFIERLKRINWLALLLAPIWFLYRKMYLYCLLYIVIVVGISEALDRFGIDVPAVSYAVTTAFIARMVYLYYAAAKIKKIRAQAIDEDDAQKRIAAQGGTSMVAALIGVALIIAFMAIAAISAREAMQAKFEAHKAALISTQEDPAPAGDTAPQPAAQ